jgi:hypothetical protein
MQQLKSFPGYQAHLFFYHFKSLYTAFEILRGIRRYQSVPPQTPIQKSILGPQCKVASPRFEATASTVCSGESCTEKAREEFLLPVVSFLIEI